MTPQLGTDEVAAPQTAASAPTVPKSIEHILVLEDSMIIALDSEETLLRLGIPNVTVAGNVAAALQIIRTDCPDAALLDYNLGHESSEPVALELERRRVPYWFVTGYGDAVAQLCQSRACGVLQKPHTPGDLARALEQLRSAQGQPCSR
jgi:DNA-binding NtrC family response regulator